MPFSAALMLKIKEEAAALGLRSASTIAVALREQLVDEKTGNMDGRARDYWVVGRVVSKGWATPLPTAVKITGLEALSGLARSGHHYIQQEESALPLDCAKAAIPGARVSLTRNNHAHVVVVLPTSRKPPETPDAWVDLWTYKSEADAVAKLVTLRAGKVF